MKRFAFLLAMLPALAIGQPQPTESSALLNGFVTDMDGKPSAGDIITFTSRSSGKVIRGTTNARGQYSLLLPKGNTYDISYRLFGDDAEYSEVSVPAEPGLMTFTYTIKYELPDTYVLNNVFFDSGKSSLKPESHATLNRLAEVLKQKPNLVLEVAGHTDSNGSEASNKTLSQARASSVVNFLVAKGIQPKRLRPVGYGEAQPVASNETASGRAQNRRTVVRVLAR